MKTNFSSIRELWNRLDKVLFFIPLVLLCCGLLSIYSQCALIDQSILQFGILSRQIIWSLVGLIFYFFIVLFDYKVIYRYTTVLYAILMVMLLLLLVIDYATKGASRWFNLGFMRFQPSEFGKIVWAFVIAFMCSNFPPKRFYEIGITLAVAGATILPILLQPDLGSTLVYVVMLLAVFVVACIPWKYIWGLVGIALGSFPLLWPFLKEYQKLRILVFINPSLDPRGAGYNVIQSRIAVGSGGFFGKGFMQGTQGKLHFLPEPHTDFIFSVFSEEFGFVGSSMVILLYVTLMMRILQIAEKTQDEKARYVCIAIVACLWFAVTESVAMTVGLAPVTGIPLPLFSYGGSSILVTFMMLGIVQSIGIAANEGEN